MVFFRKKKKKMIYIGKYSFAFIFLLIQQRAKYLKKRNAMNVTVHSNHVPKILIFLVCNDHHIA